MSINVKLDIMLAIRKRKSCDLAAAVGITAQNLSLLKQGKVKGMRFSTLAAICAFLDCQPGDLLEYRPEPEHGRQPAA
jgi:putative transcriptional regulator